MAQIAVSIVIPVWNQWQFTKACLDSLRPTLGVRDEVIVVDNGSEDQTAAGLKHIAGIQVITNETNRGFAIACNQGAAAAKNDVVVFLNNDTLTPGHWLDGLIAPFADESVAATGPRSNMVSGPQMVDGVDYSIGSMPELRRFAKQWQTEHKGQTSETPRLVGFCLAVRRSAFEAINGFDETFEIGGAEDDDLGIRLIANGGKMLICHDSFVHHHGHATFDGNGLDWFAIQQDNMDRFRTKHGGTAVPRRETNAPLLSACMIVKDEAELLPKCLTALNGLVDEVVIYDTGSSDNTVQLARDAGATVIEGFWDDDFGRARNAALDACTAEWAMQVDADEVFEGDPRVLRDTLLNTHHSAMQVEILNLGGTGRNNMTHRPCRLFKRALYKWNGRLHEQVVMRSGVARTDVGIVEGVRLVHSGYTPEMMLERNKAERNIRIATLDQGEDDNRDPMDKLTNLARSYTFAGDHEEALALYTQARSMSSPSAAARRMLLRAGAQSCLTLNRPGEALSWAEELGMESEIQDSARYLKGQARALMGHWEAVLQEFEGLDTMTDDDGMVFPEHIVHVQRSFAYGTLERWDECAEEVAQVATAEDISEPIWALGINAYWRSGREVGSLLSNVPSSRLNEVFGQLVNAPAEASDQALEYLYADVDARPSVLALAIRVAPHLQVERALEWSARLREASREADCPLIARAWSTDVPSTERVRAAAVAGAAFNDARAESALKNAAIGVSESDFEKLLTEISDLAPSLLEPLVIGASTSPERSYAMGRALHKLGADEEGVAVVLYGFELAQNTNQSLASQAADWLESVGHAAEAATLRKS